MANRPKISVKISIVSRGWTTAQATPSTVCLYRTETSRKIRKASSSRCDHISFQLTLIQPESGRMIISWSNSGTPQASAVAASASSGRGRAATLPPGGPMTVVLSRLDHFEIIIAAEDPRFQARGWAALRLAK